MEGSHLGGYAWGAVAIQSNSTIGEMTAWSIKAVKPSGWFCTTLSKDGSFVVHIFRTGYRFRNSTQDQWTYLAQPRHSSEVCPLASIRRYVEQLGSQPKNASNFVNELVNFAKFAYPSGQFDHEQFNVMVVTSQGRKLLGREMDYSFPVYFYDGHGAWCMKSTANGWLVVVIKIGYEDPNEESFSHSRRVL
uniref:Uncharacterized protein n=1 Tax=Plectus sambesii TaxID=2011161 RepID=A0A914XI73_9BILA